MNFSIFALAHVIGVLTSIHAVMSTRTAQGAIAWSVSLITFPYLAVPAYWVFGRNKFQGYVVARQRDLASIEALSQQARDEILDVAASYGIPHEAILGAEQLARIPSTTGNRAELLVDGEETFASILAGIDAAQAYVLVQFYIVRDDGLGRDFKEKLITRAREGIRIHFLYDEIGSAGLAQSYLDDLRAVGVEIHAFDTGRGALVNRFQLNFRNHRKIVVVDGRVAWIGGHNVGDEYLGKDPKFGNWRDTHVRIEGPAAIAAQLAFVEDWRWAADALPRELSWVPYRPEEGKTAVLVIPSGPADRLETAGLMYTQAIGSARERIWIASPYFVPEEGLVAAIQLASLRGVDVRILIPDNPDRAMVGLAAYSFFNEVSEAGAQFYRYTDGFLHQKVMLIDDTVALVGTANFDNRSFRLNFEITGVFMDPAFASDVEEMLKADFARSRLMVPNEFDEKPPWFRLAARVSRLASPVL